MQVIVLGITTEVTIGLQPTTVSLQINNPSCSISAIVAPQYLLATSSSELLLMKLFLVKKQSSNALLPMLVTLLGIVREVREEHL